jgi:hypothetical protein
MLGDACVFGLAYGQRQADVLAEEGVTARNIRKWLDGQARLENGRPAGDDEALRLRAGDLLLVVDEAGAASTPDLVAIHRYCAAAGVKLLLVGDQQQLTAVGAGGALADIAAHGIEYQLAEVRRFHNEWEGPASLRLRVVDEYIKHGRLVDAGTIEQAEQAAGRAWLASPTDCPTRERYGWTGGWQLFEPIAAVVYVWPASPPSGCACTATRQASGWATSPPTELSASNRSPVAASPRRRRRMTPPTGALDPHGGLRATHCISTSSCLRGRPLRWCCTAGLPSGSDPDACVRRLGIGRRMRLRPLRVLAACSMRCLVGVRDALRIVWGG